MKRALGSIYDNNGYWYYRVQLPGEKERKTIPLKAPGAVHAMKTDRPRKMAEDAAHRIWEAAWHVAKANGGEAPTLVAEAVCAFGEWAEGYYRGSNEAANCRGAVRILAELYGDRALGELVHSDMMRVRDALIARGLCRKTINRHINILTHRFSQWALDAGVITAAQKVEISQLAPIKRGRTAAPERPPVLAAKDVDIEAAVVASVPHMAAMIRVHRLTGMRPGEICRMKWEEIERGDDIWIYRPQRHKNDWRGEFGAPRVVLIGPKAQAILEALGCTQRGYVFSPRIAVAEWVAEKRAKRTSPFYPCRDENYTRALPSPTRSPGDHWGTCEYNCSVKAAIERGGGGHFTPNQLRHAFATEVRRKFGLEACRAVLGHSMGSSVTDIYSFEAMEEEIIEKARAAVLALG